MSYKNLEIWQLAREVIIAIHKMSIEHLPKFKLYEEGSQIRRSAKSIKTNIVEGYGCRQYKNKFINFLTYAIPSNDVTIDHLETLFETQSLNDKELYISLHEQLEILGKKLNLFIKSVIKGHISEK